MKLHIVKITTNFFAILSLLALISAPIYFASKFTNVAGVKSESKYLIISQTEEFPGMKFSQEGTTYTLALPDSAEAYLAVLILNNPTNQSRTYTIVDNDKVFFGENLEDKITVVSLPAGLSIPVSVLSQGNTEVEFTIN